MEAERKRTALKKSESYLARVARESGPVISLHRSPPIHSGASTQPLVIDAKVVGVGPEAIKFFRVGSRLLVTSANKVSGTVAILEVVF